MEAALVWGGIGALCFVVIIESAAMLSYNRALKLFQEAREGASGANLFTADQAMALVVRKPTPGTVKIGPTEHETYEWNWFSFFKIYRIKIIVAPQNREVLEVRTGTDIFAEDRAKSE